jgi:hypothetical protein
LWALLNRRRRARSIASPSEGGKRHKVDDPLFRHAGLALEEA